MGNEKQRQRYLSSFLGCTQTAFIWTSFFYVILLDNALELTIIAW
jgi:hypothetical protein